MIALESIPAKLNGYPVIERVAHTNCATVLLHDGSGQRFIVATWWPDLGSTWQWGHYHHYNSTDVLSRGDAHDDAANDYADTAKTNSQR